MDECESSIRQCCDNWNSKTDTADATALLQRLQHLRGGRRRKTIGMARSKLEDDLKQNVTRVDISKGSRNKLRRQLFKERGRIAKQKEFNHYREVVQNLRRGGWGKQAMALRLRLMTACTLDDGTVPTHSDDIATAATKYYDRRFRPEMPEIREPDETDSRGRNWTFSNG